MAQSMLSKTTMQTNLLQKSPGRQNNRLHVCLPVALCTKNYRLREKVYTANISEHGLFLYTENYGLDLGEKVCLEIATQDGQKLHLLGTVCWTNLFPVHEQPKSGRGVGIRFQEGDDSAQQQWSNWFKSFTQKDASQS